MHRTLLSICLFVSSLGCVIAQTGLFFPAERFSSGLINDICQDRYGYMWIATENGLNKFDGYRFTTYLHHPDDSTTLSSNIVVKLYCDKKGQLWVGTRTGLSRYDYATNKFIHYPFDNEKPRVTTIMERRNGEFLIGTSGRGLFTLIDGRIQKPFRLFSRPPEKIQIQDDGSLTQNANSKEVARYQVGEDCTVV